MAVSFRWSSQDVLAISGMEGLALRLPPNVSLSGGPTTWGLHGSPEQIVLPPPRNQLVVPKAICMLWQVISSRGSTPKSEVNPGGIEARNEERVAPNGGAQHLGSRPRCADNQLAPGTSRLPLLSTLQGGTTAL